MDQQRALPLLKHPHDALRMGLGSLKDEASVSHPIEPVAKAGGQHGALKVDGVRNLYGSALPARRNIEAQILSRAQRLPGIPSSRLGLESLTGVLDDFDETSYLGLELEAEVPPPDMHSQMENKLGLATQDVRRGFI